MRYTRTADAAIRAELLALEREMCPVIAEPEMSGAGAFVVAFDELYRDHEALNAEATKLRNEVTRWRAFCYGALFVAGVLFVAVLGLLHSIGGR